MKKIYRQLFKIVLPISFQFVMMSLVSASDAFMLGFLDQDSLVSGFACRDTGGICLQPLF